MRVRVCINYDDYTKIHFYTDFEYFSKFNKINAKGIEEEIDEEGFKRFGCRWWYCVVIDFYKLKD